MSSRWACALREAGAPQTLVTGWHSLRAAIASHQKLLLDNGIGKEVSERERVRVNARRVGLEAPPFADEADATLADFVSRAFEQRTAAAARGDGEARVEPSCAEEVVGVSSR